LRIVVARLVGLDEVVLEQDGLELVVRGHEVDGLDLVDQRHGLAVPRAAPDEIGADPALQIPRLADVDDLPLGVLVHVHAGAVRQLLEPRFESFETVGHREVV